MTDSRATGKARNGVYISVPYLHLLTESIRWRVDHHLARGGPATRAEDAVVGRAATFDQRWSGHAPVTVQYR